MEHNISYITHEQWDKEVLQSERGVVVDFYSSDCPPCEALAAKYESLAAIYDGEVKFIKIFRQENRDLAESLGVKGSPTVLFFKNGKQVGPAYSGGIRRADLEQSIHSLMAPETAAKLKAREEKFTTEYDILIIGAGPAGLTAAIYAAQAKMKTILVDKGMPGGNVSITHQVSNYPGFVAPQPGFMLSHYMAEQAKEAGAEFRQAVDITSVDLKKKELIVDGLETIRAKKIILATGSSPRPLGIPGEIEYKGKGVSYCATCDAKYYEGKHVIIIGGGNTAIEEALFIDKFAGKITVIHQFDKLQANKTSAEKAMANPNIEFVFEHEPRAFIADNGTVNKVEVENLKTGERSYISGDGVFVFVGMLPNLDLFDESFELDEWGYLQVDESMHTNIPDVFAAGDIIHKQYRQITTAVADGTIAAIAAARELEE
ncbi:MAG: FAD-dependent oxidoreductase [Deltaproteobacteria bacterium]|nr:FAD-dependent oxidoreductase [Deltaproteobacteria bacterium]MBN2672464.1 FAD-dependent oxidoreductase [Deltaproteobacteria bacterium]